jgi:hypothetical protein
VFHCCHDSEGIVVRSSPLNLPFPDEICISAALPAGGAAGQGASPAGPALRSGGSTPIRWRTKKSCIRRAP